MNKNNLILNNSSQSTFLHDVQLSAENENRLSQFVEEYKHIEILKLHNLPIDNKILLSGHSGCGKTMTAHAIANELNKEILILDLGGFVSARLGETGKNILNIFHKANRGQKVLFIDEFDFLGSSRTYGKYDSASGEMKRLVNTVIQQIDQLNPECLLIAATNHLEAIDSALIRRFQLRIKYKLPDKAELDRFYNKKLDSFPAKYQSIERHYNVSYAEAEDQINSAIKKAIINEEKERIKLKKQYLFSYGTLKQEKVQLELYGRILQGNIIKLTKYKLSEVENKDKSVGSQSEIKLNPIAVYSGNPDDEIEGVIYEITDEELVKTDQYIEDKSKRELQLFESGQAAWVYVKK